MKRSTSNHRSLLSAQSTVLGQGAISLFVYSSTPRGRLELRLVLKALEAGGLRP